MRDWAIVLALAFTPAAAGGCTGEDTEGEEDTFDPAPFCDNAQACEMMSSSQAAVCGASLGIDEQRARLLGCGSRFDDWFSCLAVQSSCEGGVYDHGGTYDDEAMAFQGCVAEADTPGGPLPVVNGDIVELCRNTILCEGGGELEEGLCRLEHQESIDVATALGCGAQMKAYYACGIDNFVCADAILTIAESCQPALEEAQQCMAADTP